MYIKTATRMTLWQTDVAGAVIDGIILADCLGRLCCRQGAAGIQSKCSTHAEAHPGLNASSTDAVTQGYTLDHNVESAGCKRDGNI